MGNKAPKVHVKRRNKKRKPAEQDPIKLLMARGLNVENRRQPILDEEGKATGTYEIKQAYVPKGVILRPVQTMVLAKYIQQLNQMLEMALADDSDSDSDSPEPRASDLADAASEAEEAVAAQ